MNLKIDHLFDHPEYTPLVAGWIYREFWADRDGYSCADLESLLRDATDPDRIPLSLIALAGGRPAGTVNLIHNDDASRPHLHPWLAALVVLPEFRRQGIGSMLVERICQEAARLGHAELFFGTDIPGFYERLGAEHHEQATPSLSIMRFGLVGSRGILET